MYHHLYSQDTTFSNTPYTHPNVSYKIQILVKYLYMVHKNKSEQEKTASIENFYHLNSTITKFICDRIHVQM